MRAGRPLIWDFCTPRGSSVAPRAGALLSESPQASRDSALSLHLLAAPRAALHQPAGAAAADRAPMLAPSRCGSTHEMTWL